MSFFGWWRSALAAMWLNKLHSKESNDGRTDSGATTCSGSFMAWLDNSLMICYYDFQNTLSGVLLFEPLLASHMFCSLANQTHMQFTLWKQVLVIGRRVWIISSMHGSSHSICYSKWKQLIPLSYSFMVDISCLGHEDKHARPGHWPSPPITQSSLQTWQMHWINLIKIFLWWFSIKEITSLENGNNWHIFVVRNRVWGQLNHRMDTRSLPHNTRYHTLQHQAWM
jgi:hypothetical protein